MNSKILMWLLLTGLVVPNVVTAETLTMYAVNFPPYEIDQPTGGLKGHDVEVFEESFKRVGIDANVEFMPWKRIIAMSKKGRIPGTITCSKNKERERFMHYSDEISLSTWSFIVKANYKGKMLNTLDDARGLKVVAVSGYASAKDLDIAGVVYEASDTDESAMQVLMKRGFDAHYNSKQFIQYLSAKMGYANDVIYFPIKEKKYYVCFAKKWEGSKRLKDKFNEGLKLIKEDGTYDAIHAKYR